MSATAFEISASEFSHRLKFLRVANGLTQSDLARQAQVSLPSIGKWELGKSLPSLQYACQLALVLGCSTDQLAGLQPIPGYSQFNPRTSHSDILQIHEGGRS